MIKVKIPTEYYEELAKNTLATYVDKKYEGLELHDRPDLQSKELDIGIEVTLAKDDQENWDDAFARETFNSTEKITLDEAKANQAKMKASGDLYQSDSGSFVISKEITSKIGDDIQKAIIKHIKDN